MQWARDFPDETREDKQELMMLCQRFVNGGSDIHRIEALLEIAPDNVRPYLLQTGFQLAGSKNRLPIEPWIDRIAELPPDQQPGAAGSLAHRWAAIDPTGAANWAANLSDERQRVSAYGSVARSWAQVDSYECSEWVGTLEHGPERDASVVSLVSAVRATEPIAAWTWAQTIAVGNRRTASLERVLDDWRAKDEAAARAAVEKAEFSDAEREKLRAVFDRPLSNSLPF